MATEVIMPRMSDTMEEGKILTWLKEVGDRVEVGDIIAEVETDKADMEMEALDDGFLTEIRAQEGESVPVGGVIALLGEEAEIGLAPTPPARTVTASASIPPAEKRAETKAGPPAAKKVRKIREAAPKKPPARKKDERILASPIVRKIAAERGIELARVRGSGPGGRIIKQDLEGAEAAPTAVAAELGTPPLSSPAARPPTGRVEPFSRMRATIAKRMADSMREAPHFYVTTEIDMSEAVRLRTSLKLSDRVSAEVTYTHLLVKAVAVALGRHPRLNASFSGDGRELKAEINVGIAVALDDGLIVPVLHDCQAMSLLDIAAQANALVERARAGKPTTQDLSGGSFTISNLGMYPVEHFTAVINPPQAAILATSAIKERPSVRDGQVVISRTMMATLSCDHRVLDGATAAQFLEELKNLLENPVGLMV
jgi:pyruvate dehydrogenase E2 component (dihydrolipoamide acetyltransferase)